MLRLSGRGFAKLSTWTNAASQRMVGGGEGSSPRVSAAPMGDKKEQQHKSDKIGVESMMARA